MSTALVIIDLQNWFLEVGTEEKVAAVPTLIAGANRLLDLFHERNLPVIRIQTRHKADGSTWTRWMKGNNAPLLIEGARDAEEHPDLHGAASDVVVVKTRNSAFINTHLEAVLKALGVETLVLAGFSTDHCVGLTAIEAQQREFKVELAGDAILGTSVAAGQRMLDYLRHGRDITPLSHEQIIALLDAATGESGPTIASHRYEIRNGLILRTFRPDDAEELCRVVDANRQHLRAWMSWVDANTEVEHSRLFIESTWKQYAEDKSLVCAVVLHDRIVGVAGYHALRGQNRAVSLGYWLAEEATGQGIMTDCCRFLTDYAFASLDLNRVEIGVAIANARSRAIPERLGFFQEGIIRDAEWLYDHYVDHAVYAMLKRDWPTRKA
jgi:ribosomal-protein-serine acetyltransferase